jgi:hypothetical protein
MLTVRAGQFIPSDGRSAGFLPGPYAHGGMGRAAPRSSAGSGMVLFGSRSSRHPDSPTFWEVRFANLVKSKGWPDIGLEWAWHPGLRLLLAIYVDDFKMSGLKENMAAGWALFREVIDMEDPTTQLFIWVASRLNRP